MTGKQTAVLWMGLILIMIRLFTTGQWQSLWSTVVKAPASSGGSPSAQHSSSENGATGSVMLA